MRWWKIGLAVTLSLLAAACASKIESDVARFHKMDGVAVEKGTFSIVPMDPGKVGGLEFQQYAALVRGELAKLGWTPVNAANKSDYVVEMDYGLSDGEQVIRSRPTAFYGFYGPYGSHRLYSHMYYPYGLYDPFWNDYYDREVYSYTVYTRRLEMNIYRSKDVAPNGRETVFEGRAESVGRDNRLPEIMPYLVQAMFTNFPGESGVTKRVAIELPDSKGKRY